MEEQVDTTVCYRHPDRPTRLSCSECGRPICEECSYDTPVGQRCPECARPTGRNRVVTARQSIRRPPWQTAPVSFGIIGLAVLLYLAAPPTLCPPTSGDLFCRLAANSMLITDGEWWRVLTAAFLHGSPMHLLFNMYALYLFGPRLEREVGSVPFALLYFAAAAAGGAVSFLFGSMFQTSVGASGAIFGLFGAWMYVAFRIRSTAQGRLMFNQLGILLAINLALPLFVPNIDWRAHLGGFAAGVLIAYLWGRFAAGRPNAQVVRATIAGGLLLAALAAVILFPALGITFN